MEPDARAALDADALAAAFKAVEDNPDSITGALVSAYKRGWWAHKRNPDLLHPAPDLLAGEAPDGVS